MAQPPPAPAPAPAPSLRPRPPRNAEAKPRMARGMPSRRPAAAVASMCDTARLRPPPPPVCWSTRRSSWRRVRSGSRPSHGTPPRARPESRSRRATRPPWLAGSRSSIPGSRSSMRGSRSRRAARRLYAAAPVTGPPLACLAPFSAPAPIIGSSGTPLPEGGGAGPSAAWIPCGRRRTWTRVRPPTVGAYRRGGRALRPPPARAAPPRPLPSASPPT
mmetsp:Transcript_5198/g.17251  ORF Transcript_5198/g.17251 Transcript_5198/m.17251 type:complete len:217 (+) Transcript_5198:796-1446(+)